MEKRLLQNQWTSLYPACWNQKIIAYHILRNDWYSWNSDYASGRSNKNTWKIWKYAIYWYWANILVGWWPILGDTNRTWSNQFNPHCWIFRKSRFVSRTSKSFDVVWKLICWLLFFISAPPIQIAFLNIQLYTVTLLHWQVAVYLYLCLGYNLYCFLFGLISLLSQDDVLS